MEPVSPTIDQAVINLRTAIAAGVQAEKEWDAIVIEDEEGFEHHVPFPNDVTTGDSKKRKAVDEAPLEQAPAPKKVKTDPPADPISGNADYVAYVDKTGEPLLSDFRQRLKSWAQVRVSGATI